MKSSEVIRFFFPAFPASYYCDYPLAASVWRLEQTTRCHSNLECLVGRPMHGSVTEREVTLYRSRFPNRAGFYPMVFSGSFQQTEDGLVLAGSFSMAMPCRLYLCFILGVLAFFFVGSVVQTVSRPGASWWFPTCLFGAIVVSMANVKWGQRAFSNARWLSRKIAHAVHSPAGIATRRMPSLEASEN